MRLPLSKRRGRKDDNDGPCPRKNGTTVGTIQEFTLLCGLNLAGTIINSTDVKSLDECADHCALTHPKCEGFSLNDGNCEMKGDIDTDKTHEARGFNAAMGLFPSASSNCGKLGSSTTAGNTEFNVFCDSNIDGNDISQSFAASFQDCLGQCTSRKGCGSVSFDPSMSQGFQNCYLKGPAAKSKTVAKTGIDTAIVNNDAVAASASASPSSITSAPVQSIDPEPETTSGGSFSTIFPTSVTSEIVTSIVSTASGGALQTIATTEIVTVAVTESAGLVAASSTAQPDVSITTTKAWVAAPVVGAIAAATVFAVAYVMWGRRRAAAGSPSVFNKLPFIRSKSNVSSIASVAESRPQSKLQSKPQSRDLPFGNTWRME